MATIKSYSDLQQSRKLAEILPLESANMIWDLTIPDLPTIRAIPYKDSDYSNKYLNIIPCWSLAALLDVLPSASLDSSDDKYYRLHCMKRYTEWYDNSIDACYEAILNLNKEELL